jgi:hypothetical protein
MTRGYPTSFPTAREAPDARLRATLAPGMSAADPSPAPARPAAKTPAPGAKRARHQRLTRVATTLTIVGLLVFGAVAAVVVRSFLTRPTAEQTAIEGTRRFLDGMAEQVGKYREIRGRMPQRLADLRAPDLDSRYDAEPWDRWAHPFEYRLVDAEGGTFRIRSYGPDGVPDTADDVVWPRGATWR